MRILSKQEFIKSPNGTVFSTYSPDTLTSELCIKTGQYEDNSGWNGELSLEPYIRHDTDDDDYCYTNWSTVDTSIVDYPENQLFAVFSKTEIRKIIDCLQWALTDCKSYFDEDSWYHDENRPLKDEDFD